MFKFIHAADIHLDSPLRGLERYEGAPAARIRQAARQAFENLVQLAVDERVAFVLIAGDLYDGDWRDYHTGLYFVAQMQRLREGGVPVFLITGNHDAANKMTRMLRLPDNVTMLSTEEPETHILEDVGVAIHGQGFATPAVTEDLTVRYPPGRRGYFNIGMLHTSVNGREGHESYAPCTLDGLRVKRYDYWALGHVHKREILHLEDPIVFPGNLQGRHIRETGPKGCMLVTVSNGRHVNAEFRCLDVLRWELCAGDAGDLDDGDALVDQVSQRLRCLRHESDGRPLAVRVEVRGPCPAHDQLLANPQRWTNEIRAQAIEIGGDELWIEKVKFHTAPPLDLSGQAADGPMGELLGVLAQLHGDEGRLKGLRKELKELDDLARKLPGELMHGTDGLSLDDADWLRGVLDQVRPLLVNRLLSRGNGR